MQLLDGDTANPHLIFWYNDRLLWYEDGLELGLLPVWPQLCSLTLQCRHGVSVDISGLSVPSCICQVPVKVGQQVAISHRVRVGNL